MKLTSIRARMTALFTIAIACVMLAFSAGVTLYLRHAAHRRADQSLASHHAQIAREWDEGPRKAQDVEAFVREQNEDLRGANITLFAVDAANRVIVRSSGDLPPWPPHGDSWKTVTLPRGAVTLVLALPWQATERRNREVALILLAMSAVVSAASAIGTWILVGRTLSPIDRLATQARAAPVAGLHAQLSAPSDDSEITRLVATLNELLDRQAAAAAAQGRFYAAASHELRTPLQALQGHLEVALQRPRGAEQYRETIVEADEQTRRLAGLVQSLLFLNQLEMATAKPPPQQVDLADACERLLNQQRATIESKNLCVQTHSAGEFRFDAPWNHLEVLLRNLLENAVKYTPPDGTVRVSCEESGPRLEIFNECAPIPREHLDRIFEPFYRPDSSRQSQTGGNGLGLAICKAICDANGWTVAMKPSSGGMTVCVDFAAMRPST